MDKTKIETLARLSGRVTSKVVGALERRGYDIRGKISAPINRVPRRVLQSQNRMTEHLAGGELPSAREWQPKGNPMSYTVTEASAATQKPAAQPTMGGSIVTAVELVDLRQSDILAQQVGHGAALEPLAMQAPLATGASSR